MPCSLEIGTDAFNMLAGAKLGEGIHRQVFACKLRPEFVVKVETDEANGYRSFANIFEMRFWEDNQHYKKVADWLAPCEFLSPDGRILLQRRVDVLKETDKGAPEKLPAFLTDRKLANYGWLDGRLVCIDYALNIVNPPTRLTPADFW